MGDYNVDKNYNMPQANFLLRGSGFLPDEYVLFDQWSIDSANRVSSFRNGTGLYNFKIKFDPRAVPN